MNYTQFYKRLFGPIEKRIGPFDAKSIVAIVGFDAGGPLNFSTFGREKRRSFVTYVSSELAVRSDQKVGSLGPFELMTTCNSQRWCRSILTDIGQMTLDETFDHLHTMDIGSLSKKSSPIQGVVFEKFAAVTISGKRYGLLYCHGVTRDELDFALQNGSQALLSRLKDAGIYPNTDVHREISVVPTTNNSLRRTRSRPLAKRARPAVSR